MQQKRKMGPQKSGLYRQEVVSSGLTVSTNSCGSRKSRSVNSKIDQLRINKVKKILI
jgi:hypothetical protein